MKPTFPVGFCTPLNEPYGVFDELPAGLNKLHNLIHGVWAGKRSNIKVSVKAWICFSADVDINAANSNNFVIINISPDGLLFQ